MSAIRNNAGRRWLRTIAVIGGALALYLGASILGTAFSGSPVTGAIAANVVIFVAGLFWLRSKGHRSTSAIRVRSYNELTRDRTFWVLAIVTLVFCWLVGQAASLWLYSLVGSPGFDNHNTAMGEPPLLVALLMVLVLAPMGEEMLMRGVIYAQLRKQLAPILAAVLSTGVFSLLHLNLVQIAVTLPLGLLLAAVYERTGRLLPVILLHVGFNLLSVITPVSLVVGLGSAAFVVIGGIVLTFLLIGLYRSEDSGVATPREPKIVISP